MMRARRSGGFTLIEILVVVAIIVVIVSLAGVQLMRGPGDLVREESEHLALLLRAAREEAIPAGAGVRLRRRARVLPLPASGAQRSPQGRERRRAVASPANAAGHRD